MPSVQNIGSVDYQQVQPQNQVPELEEYMSEPQVYDAEFEEKKSASGLMKGLTALGIIAGVGGTIYGISRGKAASKYKQQAEMLEQEVSKLQGEINAQKGFKGYMKRVITGAWIVKPFIWIKNGVVKLWNKIFSKGAKEVAPKP